MQQLDLSRRYLGRQSRIIALLPAECGIQNMSVDRIEPEMNRRYDDRRHRRVFPGDEQQSCKPRVTDQEIQKWISRQHGFVPESAWIAHCKELFGLATGTSNTDNPCPPEKVAAIQQAFRHFGLI